MRVRIDEGDKGICFWNILVDSLGWKVPWRRDMHCRQ